MGDIGTVTGAEIFQNRDGVSLRRLLQVEMFGEDIRTVEQMTQPGQDINPPVGARIEVVEIDETLEISGAISDDIMPEVDPGESEFYSIDGTGFLKMGRLRFYANGDVIITSTNGVLEQAKISTLVDGTIRIENILLGSYILVNNDGTVQVNGSVRSAVGFAELKAAFDELQTDVTNLKNAIAAWVVVPADGGAALKAATAVWAGTPFIETIDPAEVPEVLLP